MHSSSQHNQREDLRVPLVLVHGPHRLDLHLLLLQNRHHRVKDLTCPGLLRPCQVQQERGHQTDHGEALLRRLVHPDAALQEYAPRDLPRSGAGSQRQVRSLSLISKLYLKILQNGSQTLGQPGAEGRQPLPHSPAAGEAWSSLHGDSLIRYDQTQSSVVYLYYSNVT